MKKGIHKKPSDFFWLILFFSILLTILSGVTSCFLASSPGIKYNLVTSGFETKKCISVVGSLPVSEQYNLEHNQKKEPLQEVQWLFLSTY
ncbi:MAG: hypothetical protein WCE84_06705 [Candidatus Rhabdochlamydia sp.]|jgi:hypothetical protein